MVVSIVLVKYDRHGFYFNLNIIRPFFCSLPKLRDYLEFLMNVLLKHDTKLSGVVSIFLYKMIKFYVYKIIFHQKTFFFLLKTLLIPIVR